MLAGARWRDKSGQASSEWIGLVLLLSALFTAALATGGPGALGASLARSIASRIVCALQPADACRRDPELVAAYGVELAGLVRMHAPQIAYRAGCTRCRSTTGAAARRSARTGARAA